MRLFLFFAVMGLAYGQPAAGWQYDLPSAWTVDNQNGGRMIRPPGGAKFSISISPLPSGDQRPEVLLVAAVNQFPPAMEFRLTAPPRVSTNRSGARLATGAGPAKGGTTCLLIIAQQDKANLAVLITAENVKTLEQFGEPISRLMQTLRYAAPR